LATATEERFHSLDPLEEVDFDAHTLRSIVDLDTVDIGLIRAKSELLLDSGLSTGVIAEHAQGFGRAFQLLASAPSGEGVDNGFPQCRTSRISICCPQRMLDRRRSLLRSRPRSGHALADYSRRLINVSNH
jgi:hypothetical protein